MIIIMILEFDDVQHAIEECVWCCEKYGNKYCLLYTGDRFGVCQYGEALENNVILEIFNPIGD